MTARRIRVRAPVTVGNVIVGFDVLGAAVTPVDGEPWGDVVTVGALSGDREGIDLQVTGPGAGDLPPDPDDNLVTGVAREVLRLAHREDTSLVLELTKNLPICSGLGSSASSAVACAVAVNEHLGRPLGRHDVLRAAALGEGLAAGARHLDNVAPCLMGGVVLTGAEPEDVLPLPWPEAWRMAIAVPRVEVSTRRAREVLPDRLPLADTATFGRHLAGFVAALFRGDADLAARHLLDDMIEPHRAGLVPGFEQAKKAALAAGALGASLSGSGPATVAIASSEDAARRIGRAMADAYGEAGVDAPSRVVRVAERGAEIAPDQGGSS